MKIMTATKARMAGTLLAGMLFATGAVAANGNLSGKFESNFYKDWPLFSTRADETKAVQSIDRFGPVGIGIELHQPAFVMKVKNVEKGSPAEGKLKVGQIIETINGQKLKDIDPRIQLGNIITAAEATDGVIKFAIKDAPAVVVQIPVLGAYSPTWPLNCPKSEKIVRGMADYLAKTGNHAGLGYDLGLLFMLSTGEEKDLAVARGWVREVVEKTKNTPQLNTYPWFAGWGGIGLCEYYLRTGDESVLPVIEKVADYLKRSMYNNGWSCRGGVEFNYYSGGQLNAAGVHCVTTLLLAKECGVKVDEHTLQAALRQFYRFAGHGNTPYGDHLPESGFVDNGKVGGLAFAMAAAASLTPDGEKSVYAKARDISAVKGFYSTSWMLHGHTGGGIGEIWRSASMGLMYDKKPQKYREFMDNRMWHYELSRRFDGSFGILGGERYDAQDWGNAYALTYTIPRKTLRITGAKPTKFCKPYKLPDRPWGTAADEVFLSLSPAPNKDGKVQDVDAEKLATDASWPIMRKLSDPNVTDEVLLMYCRHPDQGVREMAYQVIRSQDRDHLIVELLKDKDPRARHSGAMVVSLFAAGKNRPAESERLTDEMVQLLIGMVNDPAESWWTVRSALVALSVARPELLVPHVDRLCYWLQHDEWWLQSAAVSAVAGIAMDKRCYQQVLPVIGRLIASNRVMSLGTRWGVLGQLASKLKEAAPEVQALAVQVLGKAYAETPVKMSAPGGMNMDSGIEVLAQEQAEILAGLSGGLDELYKRGRERYPGRSLPHQKIFMTADPGKLSGDLKAAVSQLIRERVIPEFVGANRKLLLEESTSAVPFVPNYYYRSPKMEELVGLYSSIGVHDYEWHDFGPDPNTMRWDYFSFDPPEAKRPGTGWRYRKVTYPAGMTNWFAVDFDAKKAGWKSGLQPFGQLNGQLDTAFGKCTNRNNFCRCGYPMQTLWEKEVLLLRGTFTFPKFKEGYRYRLLVGGMSHVGAGEGFRIYVNGKQITGKDRGVDKREGGVPIGCSIDKAWWPDFEKPVTIAATSFLQIENGGKQQNRFLIWIQEMKTPPIGEKEILQSATVVPMLSAEWQALQDPDNMELDPEQGKFRWDGKFVPNEKVVGTWTQLGEVATMEAFTPAAKLRPNPLLPAKLTFAENGRTDDPLLYYTGDILMHLNSNQALQMNVVNDYLFIEAGGFSAKNPVGWKSPWIVRRRK